MNTQLKFAARCSSKPGLCCLAPQPSLASLRSSSLLSRSVRCRAWSELIAFADVVEPSITVPVAASVLAYYLMPYYQNYAPTSKSSAAEFKDDEAVRKAEYSLYLHKPARKVLHRAGLKQHGTQHLKAKSNAWHS